MGRKATTIYNPSHGINYIVRNKDGREVEGRTLGAKDKKHAPVRSNKDTPKGKEFFKMNIEGKIYTFLNSISREVCETTDGSWIFTGKRPNGRSSLKSRKEMDNKSKFEMNELEFLSEEVKELIGV